MKNAADLKYDFNVLEARAAQYMASREFRSALHIYLYMSDGDTSLDGGYLAVQIAKCYEGLDELHAAKYWYGRALEENPIVNQDCAEARKRLDQISIDDLLNVETL